MRSFMIWEKQAVMIERSANSSKEQESGISQINNAVNQLDQQTQQNASIASKTQDLLCKQILFQKRSKEVLEEKIYRKKWNNR